MTKRMLFCLGLLVAMTVAFFPSRASWQQLRSMSTPALASAVSGSLRHWLDAAPWVAHTAPAAHTDALRPDSASSEEAWRTRAANDARARSQATAAAAALATAATLAASPNATSPSAAPAIPAPAARVVNMFSDISEAAAANSEDCAQLGSAVYEIAKANRESLQTWAAERNKLSDAARALADQQLETAAGGELQRARQTLRRVMTRCPNEPLLHDAMVTLAEAGRTS